MLEYVLFSESVRDMFIAWLKDNLIEYQLEDENETFLILIDEDIDGDIQEKIEEQYDLLLDENAKITDEEDECNNALHLVGIKFQRNNGEVGQVNISPELANKIQSCLNTEELYSFVQQIVHAVSDSKNNTLCFKKE